MLFQRLFSRAPRPDPAAEEERLLRVMKLRAEVALLEQQRSPEERRYEHLKVIAGVSGVFTALIAFIGLMLSGLQWFQSDKQNRAARADERLERSLKLIAEPEPPARLAAVVSLGSFLRDQDEARVSQALLALTNTLAIEPSLTVRNSIVATLAELDPKRVEEGVLDRTLTSLAQVSRSLVQEGNLWRSRLEDPHFVPSDASIESRAISVANAIAILIRKGATISDLSRTYLAAADLSGTKLAGVRFDDAILARTNFRGADLAGASFVHADLDRTIFTEAILRNSSFEHALEETPLHHHYIEEQMARTDANRRAFPSERQYYLVYGPDFRCADLRGASFKGHPLLPVVLDGPSGVAMGVWDSPFRYANLEGVKFQSLRMFGVLPKDWSNLADPYPLEGWSGHRNPNDPYNIISAVVSDVRPLGDTRSYNYATAITAQRFSETNWRSAMMPLALRQLLEAQKTTEATPRQTCPPGRAF